MFGLYFMKQIYLGLIVRVLRLAMLLRMLAYLLERWNTTRYRNSENAHSCEFRTTNKPMQ